MSWNKETQFRSIQPFSGHPGNRAESLLLLKQKVADFLWLKCWAIGLCFFFFYNVGGKKNPFCSIQVFWFFFFFKRNLNPVLKAPMITAIMAVSDVRWQGLTERVGVHMWQNGSSPVSRGDSEMRTEAVPPKLSQGAPSIASSDTSKIGPGKHAHTHRDPRQAPAAQANSRKRVPSVVTA